MKKVLLSAIIFMIVLAGLLTGCSNNYCPEDETLASIEVFDALLEKWDDGINVAGRTARVSLPGPVSDLQEIKREVNAVEITPCMEQAKKHLMKSLEYAIEGFMAFMGQEDDAVVEMNFDLATKYLDNYSNEIMKIFDCLPKCSE